jgi:uroporphyrinogen-III synthase
VKNLRVLVTRQPEQSGSLREGLMALGATVVELPLIHVAPPADLTALQAAVDALARYEWVAFTSANAVGAVADALGGRPWPAGPRVASLGPATTGAVRDRLPGVNVVIEPAGDHRAEGLLHAFDTEPLAGCRVLVPASELARDVLASGLRARGAEVDVVTAYRTLPAPDLPDRLSALLEKGVDLVTFASPSAVHAFVAADGGRRRRPWPPAAAIGPLTEQAARAAGFEVAAVATPSTASGLVSAVREWLARV